MNAFLAFFRPRRRSSGGTRASTSSGSTLTSRTELVSASAPTPSTCTATQNAETARITPESQEGQIQDDLIKLMKSSTDLENSRIILEQDLRELWMQEGNDIFYKRRPWYDDNINSKFVFDNFLKILSILVLLNFRGWDSFKEMFIDAERRTDKDLPFKLDHLQATEWLGSRDGDEFFQKQWIFCPFIIKERQQPYDAPELLSQHRMPFIEERVRIGAGASAEVYKEVIGPHHLEYCTPMNAVNKKAKAVACKVVLDKNVDSMEFKNIVSLRKCLSTHSRIMVNIATFIRTGSPGKIHHILYDLAAFDLEKVLCGKASFAGANRHQARLESASAGRNGSNEYWAADLIQEIHRLADALEFLHDGLYDGQKMQCAHNDIKPENILVFYPDRGDADEKYPVGQWKIADFGISKIQQGKRRSSQSRAIIDNHVMIKERSGSSSLSPERADRMTNAMMTLDDPWTRECSMSTTPAKREPGKYTAPEVIACGHPQPDARKGDIWSFGCILSEVLAYSVAPGLVQELREECEKPTHLNQRFYDVDTKLVKPLVMAWLEGLSQRTFGINCGSMKWVEDCVKIIKTIFSPTEPRNRPEAQTIRNELQKVYKDMVKNKNDILRSSDWPEGVQHHSDGLGFSISVPASRDRSPSNASNLSQSPELISELHITSQ